MSFRGRSDRVIKPGQSDTMGISVSTQGRAGEFSRRLSVTTNDPKQPTVQLTCRGTVLVPIKTDPRSVNFPKISRTTSARQQTVKILRGDGGPISPVVAGGLTKGIEVQLREITPGEEYALEVTIKPPWPNGPIRRAIGLKTGVPEAPQTTIRVLAAVTPRLEVRPKQFRLPAKAGKEFEQRVTLQWNGGPPRNVLSVTASDKKLNARLEGEGDGQQVVLQVPAGYTAPRRKPFVIVRTDDQEAPSLRISVVQTRAGRARRGASASAAARRQITRQRAAPPAGPPKPASPTATPVDKPGK